MVPLIWKSCFVTFCLEEATKAEAAAVGWLVLRSSTWLRRRGRVSPCGERRFLKRSLSTLRDKQQEVLDVLHCFLFVVLASLSTSVEGETLLVFSDVTLLRWCYLVKQVVLCRNTHLFLTMNRTEPNAAKSKICRWWSNVIWPLPVCEINSGQIFINSIVSSLICDRCFRGLGSQCMMGAAPSDSCQSESSDWLRSLKTPAD